MSADGDDADPRNADGVGQRERRRRLLVLLDGDRSDDDGLDGDRTPPSQAESTGEVSANSARLRGPPGLRQRLQRMCVVTASEVGVDGAGVTVMGSIDAGLAGHRDQLADVGALTRRLEDVQLTAGEGPCLDAYAAGAPVLVGELDADTSRWLGFAPEALAAGAAAVFSLPLQVGAVRLGTLDLNRLRPGPLSRDQLADALVLAGLATEALLELAEHPELPNDPDASLGQWDSTSGQTAGWLPDVHADVHVASGMVSRRAGIDVGSALLRIRAHAFASGEAIGDVARRIIDRELFLDHPGTGDTEPRDGPSVPDSSPEKDS